MEAGAAGISSGLAYAPGLFAETEELVELCRVVARYGGLYATHMRDQEAGLLDSVEESLRVGREEAGVPVQISHHKAMGEAYWGRVRDSLARVDEARVAGQDVTLDVYPYTAVSTTVTRFLPAWTLEGGVGALMGSRFRSCQTRAPPGRRQPALCPRSHLPRPTWARSAMEPERAASYRRRSTGIAGTHIPPCRCHCNTTCWRTTNSVPIPLTLSVVDPRHRAGRRPAG